MSTVKRLEAGDPRMQLHVLARVLHLFGELGRLDELLGAGQDEIGLALVEQRLPQRCGSGRTRQMHFEQRGKTAVPRLP